MLQVPSSLQHSSKKSQGPCTNMVFGPPCFDDVSSLGPQTTYISFNEYGIFALLNSGAYKRTGDCRIVAYFGV